METILTILIPVTYLVMLVIERLFPRRELPKVRGWMWKGLVFFVVFGVINTLVPALIATAVGDHAPLRLGGLGTVLGAILGIVVADLVGYAAHRTLHNVNFMWRWAHQMHHSAERVDVAGAVYFQPFDLAFQGGAVTLATLLLGLSPDAAALTGFFGFFAAMFQHMNIRTPQWLGYIIQRPEAHSLHHGRGIHAYNYGGLGLWDLVFGTFRNPATFDEPAGFWDGGSAHIGAMLLGQDIAARDPQYAADQDSVTAPKSSRAKWVAPMMAAPRADSVP